MITGDYGLTAESIARRVGMVGEGARLVSGSELDAMADPELAEVLKGEVIFARAAPEHKLRVVTALKDLGEIVAVTGDGVNDAPALKKAHIGVAMGIAGTDVAKEAASMILLDDNFASIVNAIEEGRAVYSNIRKFTTYIFTSNTPEAWPFIFQIVFNIPLALDGHAGPRRSTSGTDLVPALALGTEKPEPGLMDRPPRGPKDRIVDRRLIVRALPLAGQPADGAVFRRLLLPVVDDGLSRSLPPAASRISCPMRSASSTGTALGSSTCWRRRCSTPASSQRRLATPTPAGRRGRRCSRRGSSAIGSSLFGFCVRTGVDQRS